MKILFNSIEINLFPDVSGIRTLDASIAKFRELRDEYREANRAHFGDHLFAMLDEK